MFTRLPTLVLPATAPDLGIGEVTHQTGNRIGQDDGISVNGNNDFALG
jgi:hypothetical protein